MVNFSLEGKVALVTGASYGIGFALHLHKPVQKSFLTILNLSWLKKDWQLMKLKELKHMVMFVM